MGGACNMYEPLLKSNLLPLIRQLLDNEDAGGWAGRWCCRECRVFRNNSRTLQ